MKRKLLYLLTMLALIICPTTVILGTAPLLILAWLAIMARPAYAYEDYTHWGITSVAVSRLRGEPSYTVFKEVNSFLGPVESIETWFGNPDHLKRGTIRNAGVNIAMGTQGILWGSIAEDYLGDGFDIDQAIVQNHYYNPATDGGLSDWEGARDFGHLIGDASLGNLVRGVLASNPGSATVRAQGHWDVAKKAYVHGSIRDAYSFLGRVVHLLEDMTEPAHTRNDNHLGAMYVNFPEVNDHLHWTTYEKWCDSVVVPISEDSAGKPHPFELAVRAGEEKPDSRQSGLRREYREELARNPELLKKYQDELQAGKLHIDFMELARRNGWDVEPDHDSDKSPEFYFRMAKGSLMMNEAIQNHNAKWATGHHSPETNESNLEEKVADQWSVVLRPPMIRDRWIKTGRISPASTMSEFLEAFEKEGYYLNARRGERVEPGAQDALDGKWAEGRGLAESYLRESLGADPGSVTVAKYLDMVQQGKVEDQGRPYVQGEVRKYFPFLSSGFKELFNDNSLPSSWSLLWGSESLNIRDRQVGGDAVSSAYTYAVGDRANEYLRELAMDTASKWFSEDTIPGNLTCPRTYPALMHLLNESEARTRALVGQGLIIDVWEHLRDVQGNRVTGETIQAEMEEAEGAWTRAGREETYSKYPFMENMIFPQDKNKNLWQLIHRRRYRFTLDYVREIAKDRFPVVTGLAAALIQGFYDSVRHVDILRDGEEKDSEGAWRNNLISVEKQEGDEDKWSVDLWVENCGGVNEDMEVRIGEVPEGWRIEVMDVEGCSGVEGEMVERVWVGTVKDVEPTPKEVSDVGNVTSPWFYEGLVENVVGHPYDHPFGVKARQNRGAKITVEVLPPKKASV